MSTLIASLANLVITVLNCAKNRLRSVRQAAEIAIGKTDWSFISFE